MKYREDRGAVRAAWKQVKRQVDKCHEIQHQIQKAKTAILGAGTTKQNLFRIVQKAFGFYRIFEK